MRNDEYCILKSFAVLEETPGVPGLDIPGFYPVSIAKGYGCDSERLEDLGAIKKAAIAAWAKSKPTVLEIPISGQVLPLIWRARISCPCSAVAFLFEYMR